MALKKIRKEYRETPKSEIFEAIYENFLYGFLGAIIIVFITVKIDTLVLIAYMTYYFFLGKVVNRPKYVTKLGKFIMFPVPTALGAFTGYKLAGYLATLF